MRAVFFILTYVLWALGGALSCAHARHAGSDFSEEGLFGERARVGAVAERAALWHVLLTKLDAKLEAGDLGEEELQRLEADLAYAWDMQDKAGLPAALGLRAEAFLEKMKVLTHLDSVESLQWPLWPAELSSPFGYRIHPLTGERKFHQGIDLRTTVREEIRSIQEGWVLHAGWAGGYGHMVEVLHPGRRFSRYAHLSQVKVKVGEKIKTGTVVGLAGDSGQTTGIHLHFELWQEGHPVDPTLHLPWIQARWP
jgi:murein DD-endopeptidase MepM/ murein hydrolase activator NlpD